MPDFPALILSLALVGQTLTIQRAPQGRPRIAWPSAGPAMGLEVCTNLARGPWSVPAGAEVSLTNDAGQMIAIDLRTHLLQCFYRLRGANPGLLAYDWGTPRLTDLWVDPLHGDDRSQGGARTNALKTLAEAWDRIPMGTELAPTGFRIWLAPGVFPREGMPNYWEARHGTFACPVIIQAADGRGTARLEGDLNCYDCRYLYLVDIDIVPVPAGDTLHFEKCEHVLARGCRLDGGRFVPGGANDIAQDNLKINQCQHVYVEECEVSGATDNTVDLVAVQYGHFVRNRLHNAQDWVMYAKGGSAYLRIEGNEIYDGGTGGFTAGQGTGFQFMVPPWLHYEAYDLKVVNNLVHDIEGAGLGVNGGYNILLAHNTLYRVGSRDHLLEFEFGHRSCDGLAGDPGRGACGDCLALGGWGTTVEDDGENYVRIPNQNILVFANLVWNPRGYPNGPQHFSIPGPDSSTNQAGSNVPVPTRADAGLVIRGNVIWNGSQEVYLGLENSSLSPEQIVAENAINTIEPRLVDPDRGDYRPASAAVLAGVPRFNIPAFSWADAPVRPPVPPGNNDTTVAADRSGKTRSAPPQAGALLP